MTVQILDGKATALEVRQRVAAKATIFAQAADVSLCPQ